MLDLLSSSPAKAKKQLQVQAAVAAGLESGGSQKKARRCCSCRRRFPDNPNSCWLRWVCKPCSWVMQKRAADDAVARSRAALLKQPDLIFLFMTVNAPAVDNLAQVEMLTTMIRWMLRNGVRSRRSAWSVVRGAYWWLDFAPRRGPGDKLLVHLHLLLVCDLAAIHEFTAEEARRRQSRGLRGLRRWVWPLLMRALRRNVVDFMEGRYPDAFQAARLPSFFHVLPLKPHEDSGCDTVVRGSRVEILENVRATADYSWATDVGSAQGQLSLKQRVAIECMGGRHRGCSGVLRGIPGIKTAIATLRRRRIVAAKMAAQLRQDDEFERMFGPTPV